MFSRPTLLDLINRTRDDVLSRLADAETLRRSDAFVYARTLAGAAHGLYGFLDWLARNVIYDTAEADMLERWSGIWGITRKAAAAASGTVTLSGAVGAVVPAGSVLQAYDLAEYTVDDETTFSTTTATATVTASTAGAADNRDAGQTLTLVSTIAGVNSTATASALSGGADEETDDALRARFLARIRQTPQGGADYDYVAWGLEVANFTRVWCYPNELGLGTVTVRGMCDNAYTDGIPQAADITALQTYLDTVRPVTAAVTAVAPIADELDFEIASLSPATTAVKAAITAALTELIVAEGEPGGTLLISHIRSAISGAAGEFDHELVSPTANVTHTTGHIPTMGTVTWS